MSEQAIQLPEEITVSVTAEHIREGKRKDCDYCPIALALAEMFPSAWPSVSRSCISLYVDGSDIEYQSPPEARKFIGVFDNGFAVEPFTFTTRRLA